jgi:hypothetical protein
VTLFHWLLVGASAWFVAVILKIAGDVAFQRGVTVQLRDWVTAVLSGLWSTVCELGLAAVAFAVWHASVWDAIVFALGAAAMEMLLLLPAALAGGIEKKTGAKKEAKSPMRLMTWRNFAIERVIALAGHIGSRVLVWIGIGGTGGLGAVGAAFGLYTLSEGLAAYGEAKDWDWLKPRVMWPFLVVQTLIVAGTIWLAIRWSGLLA